LFSAGPMLGRVFAPEEDQPNANREVVLAYSAWRRWFGGDPNIVGRTVRLNQQDFCVIGVMPQGFGWPEPKIDLWAPLGLAQDHFAIANTFNEDYLAVARLQPGVSFAQASAYLNVLSQRVIDNPISTYAGGHLPRASHHVCFRRPSDTHPDSWSGRRLRSAHRLRQYRRFAAGQSRGPSRSPRHSRRSYRCAPLRVTRATIQNCHSECSEEPAFPSGRASSKLESTFHKRLQSSERLVPFC